MRLTRGHIPGDTSGERLDSERQLPLAASMLLALTMAFAGCSSGDPAGTAGGTGGASASGGTGGAGTSTGGKSGTDGTGGTGTGGGSGGSAAGTGGGAANSGGATGSGGATATGGAGGTDAATSPPGTGGGTQPGDAAGAMETSAPPADAPPAVMRPNEPGDPCKIGTGYSFAVTKFAQPQTGVFTAWFSATPSKARTNSVVVLAENDPNRHDPPHNVSQILVRFAEQGQLDVRNGTAYAADKVIMYQPIQYDFRLVVDVPGKKYAAYVSWAGQPEVTLGTNLAFRDNTDVPTKFDHWGVEAVASDRTKVCGFLVKGN